MTRTQLLHHQEQMEAFRAEFSREYQPVLRQNLLRGMDARDIVMAELQAWRQWISQQQPAPKP